MSPDYTALKPNVRWTCRPLGASGSRQHPVFWDHHRELVEPAVRPTVL